MSWVDVDIGDVIGGVRGMVDDLHTSKEEKLAAELDNRRLDYDFAELKGRSQLAQIKVNEKSAEHPSKFVAGARPAVIWTGVIAINMAITLPQFLMWAAWIWQGGDMTALPPKPDLTEVFTIVGSLLGIGAMRSFDKSKGTDTRGLT